VSDGDPLRIAAKLAAIFESMHVRYLLGGSLASSTFGEPRATMDIDMVVDLGPEQVAAFVAAVEGEFFTDPDWLLQETRRRGSFQIVHRDSMMRVDVFVPMWTGVHLWKWQVRRRIRLPTVDNAEIDVTSAEGIVITKLMWFRSGGEVSERQWRDVLGVLKAQRATIDVPTLRMRAAEVGVDDLFERAWTAAGLG
jgi:hypothetical protein